MGVEESAYEIKEKYGEHRDQNDGSGISEGHRVIAGHIKNIDASRRGAGGTGDSEVERRGAALDTKSLYRGDFGYVFDRKDKVRTTGYGESCISLSYRRIIRDREDSRSRRREVSQSCSTIPDLRSMSGERIYRKHDAKSIPRGYGFSRVSLESVEGYEWICCG